ncbi:hypothetical protein [Methanoculleus sp.]|uniref:hypothetical protein n=1 Tax=Methanoculleus sp. TaxID=90427 RepID=UPI001BD1CE84|nr:hypothetical protein [Methanoculleus sp.]
MQPLSNYCRLLFILGLLMFCVPPAAGQAESHTTLQVYTNEEVLGRIVSITPASDVGAYSITITRGTSVQPAGVGDTLRHKDIITLQRDSFADIQLVDRSDKTMLGGGTGGTAVLVERAGSAVGQTATPEATELQEASGTIYVDVEEGEAGVISYVQGKAYIQRGPRILPATVGEVLLVGDSVAVDEGGQVTLEFDGLGTKDVYGGDRIHIVGKKVQEPEAMLEPVFTFFGGLWESIKGVLGGVQEALEPTATAGVRG